MTKDHLVLLLAQHPLVWKKHQRKELGVPRLDRERVFQIPMSNEAGLALAGAAGFRDREEEEEYLKTNGDEDRIHRYL